MLRVWRGQFATHRVDAAGGARHRIQAAELLPDPLLVFPVQPDTLLFVAGADTDRAATCAHLGADVGGNFVDRGVGLFS